MKRMIALFATLLMIATLAACSGQSDIGESSQLSATTDSAGTQTTTGNIASETTDEDIHESESEASQESVSSPEQTEDVPVVQTPASDSSTIESPKVETSIPESKPDVTQESTSAPITTPTEPEESEENDGMTAIDITIGNQVFSAKLYDNAAADALLQMMPVTLNMSELNGNEKYNYLDSNLPTNSTRPSGIHTGDLMLYGSNCLVLFYESFSTSYSYTPLGYIEDTTGLAEALGSGSVQITFSRK